MGAGLLIMGGVAVTGGLLLGSFAPPLARAFAVLMRVNPSDQGLNPRPGEIAGRITGVVFVALGIGLVVAGLMTR